MIQQQQQPSDLKIKINKSECIENNLIIDPITKENVDGYIIKDNTSISISLSNRNVIADSMTVRDYYYRNINNKNIIIRSLDCNYKLGTNFDVIPKHTYRYLKSTNRLNSKLFVVSLDYYVADPNTLDLTKKNKKLYFKLVNSDEYEAYKKLGSPNKIDINVGKNGEIIRPKESK